MEDLNRYVFKEETTYDQYAHGKLLLVMREMQSQTTMRYLFTPTRQVLTRVSRIETFMHCWWECRTAQLLCKSMFSKR